MWLIMYTTIPCTLTYTYFASSSLATSWCWVTLVEDTICQSWSTYNLGGINQGISLVYKIYWTLSCCCQEEVCTISCMYTYLHRIQCTCTTKYIVPEIEMLSFSLGCWWGKPTSHLNFTPIPHLPIAHNIQHHPSHAYIHMHSDTHTHTHMHSDTHTHTHTHTVPSMLLLTVVQCT